MTDALRKGMYLDDVSDIVAEPPVARDPRVERTRAHVLCQAQQLLAEKGPNGFTYCELAAQARVTRQTLYRHWPTRESLLVDLLLQRSMTALPDNVSGPAEEIIGNLLRRLREYLDDPGQAGPLIGLMAQADHEPMIDAVLKGAVVSISGALGVRLEAAGRALHSEDLAQLCGPLIFQRFIARQPVTDDLIDNLSAAWCSNPCH